MTIMIGNTAIGGNESMFWMNDAAVRMVRAELQYQANIVIANEYDDSGDWWCSVHCPDPDEYFHVNIWDIHVFIENDGQGDIAKVVAYPVYRREDDTFLSDNSVWITLEFQNA